MKTEELKDKKELENGVSPASIEGDPNDGKDESEDLEKGDDDDDKDEIKPLPGTGSTGSIK